MSEPTKLYRLRKEPFRSPRRGSPVEFIAVMDFREFKAGDVVSLRQTHSMRALYERNRIGIKGDTWTDMSLELFKKEGDRAIRSSYMVTNPIPGRVTAVEQNRKKRHEEAIATAKAEEHKQNKSNQLSTFIEEFLVKINDARSNKELSESAHKQLANLANGKAVLDIFDNIDLVDEFIKNTTEKFNELKVETKQNKPEKKVSTDGIVKEDVKEDKPAQMDEKAPVAKSGSEVADELEALAQPKGDAKKPVSKPKATKSDKSDKKEVK